MSLYTQLQTAKSEEDVKDAYIKALGLKGYTKGLIDIQTREIWFEAKDSGKNSTYAMFTQLLHYVQVALRAIAFDVSLPGRCGLMGRSGVAWKNRHHQYTLW